MDQIVADLAAPGARVVVARGGTGGRGNRHFATPTRQTPRFAETGLPGEEVELELRLKLLADAALVGLPNAGKSSLLRRISNAKPKVADYPFTTLQPVLGTVESPDRRQLTVADVPGLIEGASQGVGLGHEFLAHLERARLLLRVIDAAVAGPAEQFRQIDHELAEYGAGLDERDQVVVLNKIDLLPEHPPFELDDDRIVGVFHVSAATGAGIEELKRKLFELCPPCPATAGRSARACRVPGLPAATAGRDVQDLPHRGWVPRSRLPAAAGRARGRTARGGRAQRQRGRGRRRDPGDRVIGLFGGAFDPPHVGHVALADAAQSQLGLSDVVVVVIAEPGHKDVHCPVETRLALARAAFPDRPVEVDRPARTVDMLRAGVGRPGLPDRRRRVPGLRELERTRRSSAAWRGSVSRRAPASTSRPVRANG